MPGQKLRKTSQFRFAHEGEQLLDMATRALSEGRILLVGIIHLHRKLGWALGASGQEGSSLEDFLLAPSGALAPLAFTQGTTLFYPILSLIGARGQQKAACPRSMPPKPGLLPGNGDRKAGWNSSAAPRFLGQDSHLPGQLAASPCWAQGPDGHTRPWAVSSLGRSSAGCFLSGEGLFREVEVSRPSHRAS